MLATSIEDLGIQHDGQKGQKWGVSKYDKRADKYAARADKWSEKAERTRNEDRAQRYSIRSAQYSAKLDKAEEKLHKWEQISRNIETKALNYKVKSLKVKKQHDKTLTSLMKVPAIKKRLIKDIERDGFDGNSRFIRHADTDQGLQHYGTLGMKWGVRRYQNKDGTLTPAGKRRYGTVENLRADFDRKAANKARKIRSRVANAPASASDVEKYGRELKNARLEKKAAKLEEDYKQWMEKRELKAKTLSEIAANKSAYEKEVKDNADLARAEAKEKAIASGNPRKMLAYMGDMSTQEIKDAIGRVKTMRELESMVTPTKFEQAKTFVKDYAKKKIEELVTGTVEEKIKDSASKLDKDYSSQSMKAMEETIGKEGDKAYKDAKSKGASDEDAIQAKIDREVKLRSILSEKNKKTYANVSKSDESNDKKAEPNESTSKPDASSNDKGSTEPGGSSSESKPSKPSFMERMASKSADKRDAKIREQKAKEEAAKAVNPLGSTDDWKNYYDLKDRKVNDIKFYWGDEDNSSRSSSSDSGMSDVNKRLLKNHTLINDLLKKKGLK